MPKANKPNVKYRLDHTTTSSELLRSYCDRIYDYMKSDEDGLVYRQAFLQELAWHGILVDDPRIRTLMKKLKQLS